MPETLTNGVEAHEWARVVALGGAYRVFECHETERSLHTTTRTAPDFDYCPFCGEEVDGP